MDILNLGKKYNIAVILKLIIIIVFRQFGGPPPVQQNLISFGLLIISFVLFSLFRVHLVLRYQDFVVVFYLSISIYFQFNQPPGGGGGFQPQFGKH